MSWFRWLIVCGLLAASALPAQPGTPAPADGAPWMLLLGGQSDQDSYRSLSADFHLGLTEATWLSVMGGSSEAPATEPDLRASQVGLGLEHDFGPVGLRLNATRWGDSGNLLSRDSLAELFVRRERFRLGLVVERRAIDIYFTGSSPTRDIRRTGLEATGLGVSGRIRLSPRWQIYGSSMDYDYPRRVRVVPRADRLNLLSASAVTLAHSLVDEYAGFGAEHDFGSVLLNLDLAHDRSAIDGVSVRSLSAAVLWPLARRLDIEFSFGRSRSRAFGSNSYGGLSFLIYGN